jgi:LysR family transcriptional regulator, glycine cleavage system transcriptional activator
MTNSPPSIPDRNALTSVRRNLPALPLLQAFEAAARLGGITRAANELSLTQSAVSRQIAALEDSLAQRLFFREGRQIRLTPAGEAYAEQVRRALGILATATQECRANPGGGTLNLAVLPTFGMRWLAPRLGRFSARHPTISVNLHTRFSRFDLEADGIDLAVHHGSAHWPGAELMPLMSEQVLPVCSPALRDRLQPQGPRDLLGAPLIAVASRADAWGAWFTVHHCAAPPRPAMVTDQFATASQIAMAGQGVALMPLVLVAQDLDAGTLVPAIDAPPVESAAGYWLVWPPARRDHPPMIAFRDWLLEEAA